MKVLRCHESSRADHQRPKSGTIPGNPSGDLPFYVEWSVKTSDSTRHSVELRKSREASWEANPGKVFWAGGNWVPRAWDERMLSIFEEQLMTETGGVKGRIADEVMEGEGARSELLENKFLEGHIETCLGGYLNILLKRWWWHFHWSSIILKLLTL